MGKHIAYHFFFFAYRFLLMPILKQKWSLAAAELVIQIPMVVTWNWTLNLHILKIYLAPLVAFWNEF